MNTDHQSLEALGWDEFFARQLQGNSADPGAFPARITSEQRGLYRVQPALAEWVWGEITGKMRHEASSRRELPAVGDWVLCTRQSFQDRVTIHSILDRKSLLVRKAAGESDDEEQVLAANIDTAFIITSLNSDLNLRRLERYLTLVWDSGVTPVILLTKADLIDDSALIEEKIREVGAIAPGVAIHAVAVKRKQGLDPLELYLRPGKAIVLIGSSGVGKSTLVNHLLGEEVLRTEEIRAHDERGMHVTTARQLFLLDSGAMLIDTPGMRELQLLDHEAGLKTLFDDIEALVRSCRFTNCKHDSEPGCAIKTALEDGLLSGDRYASYQKLQAEIAARERRTDKVAASREKAKWKKIHSQVKAHVKQKKNWDRS